MLKKVAFAIFAAAMMISTTHAVQVYEDNVGQWKVHGHEDGEDTACILSTYWPDGAQININVFPREDGKQYTTMTVSRPQWNANVGRTFQGMVLFRGEYGSNPMVGTFTMVTPNKVITRGLSREFSNWFIMSRTMTVFPNTPDELAVGLRGTLAAMSSLDACMAKLR